MSQEKNWRFIYNPEADVYDIVAYGASVAEGRIAGKYQLSTTLIPNTLILQKPKNRGIITGADIQVDKEAAQAQEVQVARLPRAGRNSAKSIGTLLLSDLTSKASRNFDALEVDPDEPAVLIYTSGTTGNPKGAMLSHRNFHYQCETLVPSFCSLSEQDKIIGVLPLYHIYGLANAMMVSIHNGATFVLMPQYSPQGLLETIEKNKATMLPAIPSMYQLLLSLARVKGGGAKVPKSLRHCISGGAPLSNMLFKEFSKVFETQILEGYGLTESTSAVCANGMEGQYKEGSIGKPGFGVEMKVVNEKGEEVPRGIEGEILLRSSTIFKGYWNNKEATAQVLKEEGWFHTGDLGYWDEEGFFFITDRKKDIIISHGYNISPREVEEVLLEHPQVEDAAVVSRQNQKGDEGIWAIIVPKEQKESPKLEEKTLREYCELHLAPYKRPRFYEFVTNLPRSATGKVLRKELRGEVEDKRLIDPKE